jgi:hypothetical protein
MFDTHGRLMSFAVIAATVAASLATAVPASAAGSLDQSQNNASAGTECLCEPFFSLGQTFTAGITGNLDQVDLLLYRAGSPGNLTVQIRTVSGGVPSNTILSTATVAESSVPVGDPGWVSVPFSVPAISTAGTQYAIVLSAPGVSSASPLYGWGTALGNPYAGGDAVTSVDSGANWFPLIGPDNTSLDRAFKTYVAIVGGDLTPPVVNVDDQTVEATNPAGAVINYVATAVDNVDGPLTPTCNPPSGSVFPLGSTLVTCTATDAAGNTGSDTAIMTVVDTRAPETACVQTTNPSRTNVPPAKNPDGFFELLAVDIVDVDPDIIIHDSADPALEFGPFPSGTTIKLTQAPGAPQSQTPGAGDIDWHIRLKGHALLVATDFSGNESDLISCLVPPPPK